ncbi:hypothetical protein PO883_06090 [Massilia sp. DJPM01]|uniref:hypothetical protein n=1 Tax=Massilia sp. DJPM01 TaxID=3024404 RepID=UPI00259F92CA|nr:hypothetical protein [Massilia sp. DJPM01]MDM5176765.1 hypothetical protein [Massilia sp. DJPM01]
MARQPRKHINLVTRRDKTVLDYAAPAPLASAGFSELTLIALAENALRASTTPPRPMSKEDFASLLDEAQDAA